MKILSVTVKVERSHGDDANLVFTGKPEVELDGVDCLYPAELDFIAAMREFLSDYANHMGDKK